MSNKFLIYHLHSMLSNPTFMDSTANYEDYVLRAKELGMTAIAFSEHGNVYQWIKKKQFCDKHKIKYIHGQEFYMTTDLNQQKREAFHVGLYARNWEGVKELNKLSSIAFNGKGKQWSEGQHYYYRPRISLDELFATSDNIIITTACVASILWEKRNEKEIIEKILNWLSKNKHRCFLEIQHHNFEEQIEYNKLLYKWSKEYDLKLITGTDTHVLDKDDLELRLIMQSSKGVSASMENNLDLSFPSYDTLVGSYKKQNSLPIDIVEEAIRNTLLLEEMCEEWELDFSHKYPKISDNPKRDLLLRIKNGIKERKIDSFPNEKMKEYQDMIKEEFNIFEKLGMLDYIILVDNIKLYALENDIPISPRGSCNGSLIFWVLGITDVDSIKFGLPFFRFCNPDRVSLGDVDLDIPASKRPLLKDYLYNLEGINGSAIVTYQTMAERGAVRLIGKGLGYSTTIIDMVAKDIIETRIEDEYGNEKIVTTFNNKSKWEQEYPKWIEMSMKAKGIITSTGVHPCGFVTSDKNIIEEIGLFENGDSPWEISQNDMSAIDSINFVKMDFLSVDNIQIVYDTCKLANIPQLDNDSLDFEIDEVWEEMKKSGIGIFQMEKQGHAFLKESLNNYKEFKKSNPNMKKLDILLDLNAVIRPACESFRNQFVKGIPFDNGLEEINNFFSETLSYIIFQENIMMFLQEFCGYSGSESDTVRRNIAKKKGTEQLLPEIEKRFVKYSTTNFNISEEYAFEIIKKFLKVVDDASMYGFSKNHSLPYSILGYKNAYLRYYYPLEYLTVQLNVNDGNIPKTDSIIEFVNKFTDIKIQEAKFGYSRAEYFCDKNTNTIYKGVKSIKYLNEQVGNELFEMSKNTNATSFYELLKILKTTSIQSNQLDILIKLDYFEDYGEINYLLEVVSIYNKFNDKKIISEKTLCNYTDIEIEYIKQFSRKTPSQYRDVDSDKIAQIILSNICVSKMTYKEKIMHELEYLGYIKSTLPSISNNVEFVIETLYNNHGKYTVKLFNLKSGLTRLVKVKSKAYDENPFQKHDILNIKYEYESFIYVPNGVNENGETIFENTGRKEPYISKWSKVLQ